MPDLWAVSYTHLDVYKRQSLVNAIRDFAEGNYIGGGVRFLDALMVGLGVSLGVGLMYILYFRFTGRIIL